MRDVIGTEIRKHKSQKALNVGLFQFLVELGWGSYRANRGVGLGGMIGLLKRRRPG